MENPYRVGDWVIVREDIKDAYGEIWHTKGSRIRVKNIASDGNGLMFDSYLGAHWKDVDPVSPLPKTTIEDNKNKVIKKWGEQLEDMVREINKEFFPLSHLPGALDTSNKINYALNAISLARSILRDMKVEK